MNKMQSLYVNLWITVGFIEVDIDPLQLEVAVSLIHACGIESMFLTDHLPELGRQRWGRKPLL